MTASDFWDVIVATLSFGLLSKISGSGIEEAKNIPFYIAGVVLNWGLICAGLVLLGFIIYGGYLYITSTGDPQKTQAAQQTIVNAVIGMGIVVLALTVTNFIMWLLGVGNITSSSGGSTDQCASIPCAGDDQLCRYAGCSSCGPDNHCR